MRISFQDSLTPFKEQNLRDYKKMEKYTIVDLCQIAKNGRARGNTVDLCLPTLTTNSGRLYSVASWLVSK